MFVLPVYTHGFMELHMGETICRAIPHPPSPLYLLGITITFCCWLYCPISVTEEKASKIRSNNWQMIRSWSARKQTKFTKSCSTHKISSLKFRYWYAEAQLLSVLWVPVQKPVASGCPLKRHRGLLVSSQDASSPWLLISELCNCLRFLPFFLE